MEKPILSRMVIRVVAIVLIVGFMAHIQQPRQGLQKKDQPSINPKSATPSRSLDSEGGYEASEPPFLDRPSQKTKGKAQDTVDFNPLTMPWVMDGPGQN